MYAYIYIQSRCKYQVIDIYFFTIEGFLCLFYKNELKKTKRHCESIGLNLSVFRSFLVPTKFRCDHNTESALPLLFICENYL